MDKIIKRLNNGHGTMREAFLMGLIFGGMLIASVVGLKAAASLPHDGWLVFFIALFVIFFSGALGLWVNIGLSKAAHVRAASKGVS